MSEAGATAKVVGEALAKELNLAKGDAQRIADVVTAAIEVAIDEEREACAKEADPDSMSTIHEGSTQSAIARRIRSRGCIHEPYANGEIRTSGTPRTWCRKCGRLYLCNVHGEPVRGLFDERPL